MSNELSNYRGANRQPSLDDPGSFRAPCPVIDAHLGCFTPKPSAAGVTIGWRRSHSRTSMSREDQQLGLLMIAANAVPRP